ncbi:D-alanyl-D-alanine endopeptidase [Ideonella dechloratans]
MKMKFRKAWLAVCCLLASVTATQVWAADAKDASHRKASASAKATAGSKASNAKAKKASSASSAAKSKSKSTTTSSKTRTRTASVSSHKPTRATKAVASTRKPVEPASFSPGVRSFGEMYGLHHTEDPLSLRSSVAYVLDQDTNEVLLNKNSQAVLPIASITKLMTAMVVTEAHLPMDETITISQDDVDTEKMSSSRLRVGTKLTRGEMLHLALMSSENRAASALGHAYPGGISAFVAAMNAKARQLGMHDTRYVEPTGLSSQNQSSAQDLAVLVKAAAQVPLIRELSTSPEYQVEVGSRQLQYHTTNRLVKSPNWDIGVQKTGYITEAGQCLVMQTKLAGRKLIMVLLDSAGKYSRIADAERIRKWLLSNHPSTSATTTPTPIGTLDSKLKPTS